MQRISGEIQLIYSELKHGGALGGMANRKILICGIAGLLLAADAADRCG
jgi:hypothetical protein